MSPYSMRSLGIVFAVLAGCSLIMVFAFLFSYLSAVSNFSYATYSNAMNVLGWYVFSIIALSGFTSAAVPLLIVSGIRIRRLERQNNAPVQPVAPTVNNYATNGYTPYTPVQNTYANPSGQKAGFCPTCGMQNTANNAFCSSCGTKL